MLAHAYAPVLKKAASMREFLSRLPQRKTAQVAVIYVVGGWLLLQAADILLDTLAVPEWGMRLVLILILIGFPVALLIAWSAEKPAPSPAAVLEEPEPVQSGTTAPEIAERSIAVLPLVNMSQSAEDEYFSDGMSEELINMLTKLPELKVCSRTSSFAFKGKEGSIRDIASELGVNMILEGSVRRAGDRIRITAQLIDARSDTHLWSDTYDRNLEDVFAVQDDIATSIAEVLKVTLSPSASAAFSRKTTTDVEAYDYYLRGRQFFHQITRRDLTFAKEMYERAIEIDPDYGLAYAGLADCASFMAIYVDTNEENWKLADAASRKALEIAPHMAEAHASRGLALSHGEGSALAEREFEAAIALDSSLFEAFYFYARDCMNQGDAAKAATLLEQAQRLRPEDYQAPMLLPQIYRALGREDEVVSSAHEGLEIVERHLRLNPDDVRALSLGAGRLAALGEKDRAVEWIERAIALAPDEPNLLYNAACVFSLAGEKERSLKCLEEAVDMGLGIWKWMANDTDLNNVREDPRFRAVLERAKSALPVSA
jgi:adenylate cyclase